ncbi:hypothetical protein AX15_004794 [Amanita polypyramis BW_CC]|nr:hypothetical protein AX15_004794 [Amanita polypyramis BW_CC]
MLDKKSRIYSDRRAVQMGGELVGWRDALALLPYGRRFRSYRKMFHQVIGTSGAMSRFHHVEEFQTRSFLKRLLSDTEGLEGNLRRTAGAIILRIAYGYDVKEENDPFVAIADEALEQFSVSVSPGAFLVNLVPALQLVPEWLPGTGFKQTAKAWRRTLYNMVDGPYQLVKNQIELGTTVPSMLSNLLQDKSDLSEEEIRDMKWASASFYAGGADTTVSSIYAFFKAMVLHPDSQARAQAEIDTVIGNNRLPAIEDRGRLPYVSALVMEVMRWHVVAPLGSRRVMEDDTHDGYFIPKDAIVIPNAWKMLRDESVYKSPSSFDPARFVKTEDHEPEFDPRDICFGFGRR